jgi:NitT/TauT family transport system substrate-binding protein
MNRFWTISFSKALAITATVLVISSQVQAQPHKVVFAMNWSPTDHHLPYWVALETGYYAKEGFDLDIQYSKGSGDAVAKVDTSRADFAIAETTTVISAIARGAKVKIVGMVFGRSPEAIFVWANSSIKTPKDLEGHAVGSVAGGAARLLFPALAKKAGFDYTKIQWVNLDTAAKVGALTAKRVEAVTDYTTILPLYEHGMGVSNVRMIPWSDYGIDTYSVAIVGRTEEINRRTDLVSKFLNATYAGWRDAAADPEKGLRIFKKRVPELDLQLVRAAFVKITLGLVKTPEFERNGIGWIDPARMCETVTLANEYMTLARRVDCNEVYRADLIPVVHFAK